MTLKEDTVDVSGTVLMLCVVGVALFGPMFAFMYAAQSYAPEHVGIITVTMWCLWIFTLFEYATRP